MFSLHRTRSATDLESDAYKLIPYFSVDICADKVRSSYTINNWKRIVDGKNLDEQNPMNKSLEDCDVICISMNNTDMYFEQFFLLALHLLQNVIKEKVTFTFHRRCKQIWFFKDEKSKLEYFKEPYVKFLIPKEFKAGTDAINNQHKVAITEYFVKFMWTPTVSAFPTGDVPIKNLLRYVHCDKFVNIYDKSKKVLFGNYSEELIKACAAQLTIALNALNKTSQTTLKFKDFEDTVNNTVNTQLSIATNILSESVKDDESVASTDVVKVVEPKTVPPIVATKATQPVPPSVASKATQPFVFTDATNATRVNAPYRARPKLPPISRTPFPMGRPTIGTPSDGKTK